jgi:hypothetical protein
MFCACMKNNLLNSWNLGKLLMYLLILWRGHNDFPAGNIHYKGHCKGWTLKTETFLGPEMATSVASAIWAQKS